MHPPISLVLQDASEMSTCLTPAPSKEHGHKQIDIVLPLTKLKYSLSLAGKVNQSINQSGRNLVKPSLPVIIC